MRKGGSGRIVDLARPITHERPNFPGEPRPGLIHFADIGFRCKHVLMPTHFGTHIDADCSSGPRSP